MRFHGVVCLSFVYLFVFGSKKSEFIRCPSFSAPFTLLRIPQQVRNRSGNIEFCLRHHFHGTVTAEHRAVRNQIRYPAQDIFRGKITNWKQVGGDDRKIVVYSRETSSGTYEFFKENVLKNKNYMAGSLSMPATGAIIQSVSQTKGAIGYVGLAYVSPRTKTLSVSYDGSHYAAPTVENATNKTYPIVRPLYYYYNVKNKEQVAPLINFILSPEGQEIIKKSGYIPVK